MSDEKKTAEFGKYGEPWSCLPDEGEIFVRHEPGDCWSLVAESHQAARITVCVNALDGIEFDDEDALRELIEAAQAYVKLDSSQSAAFAFNRMTDALACITLDGGDDGE